MADGDTTPEFAPLSAELLANMEAQRLYVATLIRDRLPEEVVIRAADDLAVLQAIVDARLVSADEGWELQALGLAFGDLLSQGIDGLAWTQVTDSYGTDPTLRYRQTTLMLNALTMISKRVEDGEEVDLRHIFLSLKEFVETKGRDYR